jgi:hypothetical protein
MSEREGSQQEREMSDPGGQVGADAGAGKPPYSCDLILKGGITSGIVYPPAIVEIAKDHRLCSIGGASAGAIAAASAAAAELGRGSTTGGFALLERVPTILAATDASQRTVLQRLFQPQPATAELFDALWLVRNTRGRKRLRALVARLSDRGAAPASWMWAAAAATVLAIAVLVVAYVLAGPWSLLASIPLVVLVVAAGILARFIGRVAGAVRAVGASAPQAIAENFHGLCNGSTPSGSKDQALTDWLYTTLQSLAGRDDDGVPAESRTTPVTYGELRAAGIDLVTVTTDLSHGTSESFPLRGGGWAFDEAEMRMLFPAAVVDHLVESGAQPTDEARRRALDDAGLRPLPDPDALPIIFGARISLSFPLLLSAVPLYAWTPSRVGDEWRMAYVKCWFSDGGITSNLPVHLFDRPLPSRPTYAINLTGGADPSAGACDNVWRPISTREGLLPPVASITTTPQFLSAVFDTMQNWTDNSLARAPGQRDRICTVRLGTGEGGMNLDMPAETIRRLAQRGELVGDNLAWMQRGTASRCPPPGGLTPGELAGQWDRHRFVRYRTFLAGLGRYLDDAEMGASSDFSPRPSYGELAEAAVTEMWLPYRSGWTAARNQKVDDLLRSLFACDTTAMTATAPAGAALGYNANAADRVDPEP